MINGINHITLAVKDVEKSFEFYKDILSLKPVVKCKNGAYLTAGDTMQGNPWDTFEYY